jgi:dihydroorotate dehydrogenase (fumarate)
MEDVVLAGAKALVLFNRYYAVDVDLDTRNVVPAVRLSSSGEMLLPLRWVGLAGGKLGCDIAASTGIHDSEGVLKMLMMGATVVQVCSALYKNGPGFLGELVRNVSSWLDEEGFASVADIRGLALKKAGQEEALLTRLQYIKALDEASRYYKF